MPKVQASTTWAKPIWVASAVAWMSPRLLQRAMSASMALLQPGSVSMSTAPDTIKGHANLPGVCIDSWDDGDIQAWAVA